MTSKALTRRATLHLRAAAAHAAIGGRKKSSDAIRKRAITALREVAAALRLLEEMEEAKRVLARKRAHRRLANKTIARLAAEPTRRTNP